MKRALLGLAALASFSVAGAASAHHAFNIYQNEKYTTLNGTVKSFVWQNPHAMAEVMLPSGEMWTVELSAPNIIGRRGWSKYSLKAGDKLPIVIHPMKDGSNYGLMVSVTYPDGHMLKDKA